ncbi:SDR family NAD(P)-dependent oxidoreductase [Paenibacillus sp. GP183]|uniref:SDR family NAD(P)-dependent oxidoreductase n=1 Tax=Paenibacillus sp. GP183 TaxID=1882751 RepID=UPI0008955D3F|nr:SDR family NAD(P)-dependent oxidoreductase [Paenibacillus sp. GP183]SED06701.1 3-oxoacyl-[acyl-carrier protein] reductase [Paenibacillus sp. GP183]
MFNLEGKAVIVTGSGRGIGRGVAELFASLGANVTICDIDGQLAQQSADYIRSQGFQAMAIACDVTKQDEVKSVVEQTIKEYGRIDILVNNAGIAGNRMFPDITLTEWNRMFDVHLTGTFLFSKEVLPYMKRDGGGRIINISSNWGQRGEAGAVHYSAVKAGIIGFTKALARELAPHHILVNAVAPGPIETDMIEDEARLLGTTAEEIRMNQAAKIPLQRLGTIREVAVSIAFLAGETGNFYCGQVISPNGGEVI